MRGLWHGLLVGAVLSLLLIGAWHLLPLPLWTLTLAILAPFPCALAGLVICLLFTLLPLLTVRRVSPLLAIR